MEERRVSLKMNLSFQLIDNIFVAAYKSVFPINFAYLNGFPLYKHAKCKPK